MILQDSEWRAISLFFEFIDVAIGDELTSFDRFNTIKAQVSHNVYEIAKWSYLKLLYYWLIVETEVNNLKGFSRAITTP